MGVGKEPGSTTHGPRTWSRLRLGEENFGGDARLRHKNRTRRLVELADRVLEHPSGIAGGNASSNPSNSWPSTDYMANRNVTHASVLAPHQALTVAVWPGPTTSSSSCMMARNRNMATPGLRSLDDLGQLGNGHTRFPRAQLVGRPGGQPPRPRPAHADPTAVHTSPRGDATADPRSARTAKAACGKGLVKRLAQPRPDKGTSMSATAVPTYLNISSMSVSNNRLFVVRATHGPGR